MPPQKNGKLLEEAIEACWDDGKITTLTNTTTLIGESSKEITDTWPLNTQIITEETLTNKAPEGGGRQVWDMIMTAKRGYECTPQTRITNTPTERETTRHAYQSHPKKRTTDKSLKTIARHTHRTERRVQPNR